MELLAIAVYSFIIFATMFLLSVLLTPDTVSSKIQNYFFGRVEQCLNFFSRKESKASLKAYPHASSSLLTDEELLGLQWQHIAFYDKECGFPALYVKIYNSGNKSLSIAQAKFNILAVGRLHNHVEGHNSLSITPWSYNVQFDSLFEGKNVMVDLAISVPAHAESVLSFTIGQETSDVETPTLYHFHLILEDFQEKRLISKPLTVALPSPVKAKSYSMLEERKGVIAYNMKIVDTFSSFHGLCNPLANRILGNQYRQLLKSE